MFSRSKVSQCYAVVSSDSGFRPCVITAFSFLFANHTKKPFGSPKGYACANRELGYCLSRSSPPRRASALYNVKVTSLSHLKKSLNPTIPVLPMGISRYFWAVASVRIGASPNKAWFGFPHTMYYGHF